MEIKGVDISYCQSGIDYNTLKADGVKFAIIRAGFSETEDKLLKTHIDGLRKVGIPFGLYWYSYAYSMTETQKEADACIAVIKKYQLQDELAYPVFYDIEESKHLKVGKATLTNMADEFKVRLNRAGIYTGLYVNPNFMENAFDKARIMQNHDIWLAHWTENPAQKSRYNYGQQMWQWGIGKVGKMDVDGDLCFIDYPARINEWRSSQGKAPIAPQPAQDTTSSTTSPPATSTAFKVGDVVDFTGSTHYTSSTGTRGTAAKPGKAKITIIAAGAAHPYHVVHTDSKSNVYGWVDAADISGAASSGAASTASQIKVGSTVMLRNGAKDYNGGGLASFVYGRPHIVSELKGNRAVITYGGVVVAAVNTADLTLA